MQFFSNSFSFPLSFSSSCCLTNEGGSIADSFKVRTAERKERFVLFPSFCDDWSEEIKKEEGYSFNASDVLLSVIWREREEEYNGCVPYIPFCCCCEVDVNLHTPTIPSDPPVNKVNALEEQVRDCPSKKEAECEE